jgi:hypothetical protein
MRDYDPSLGRYLQADPLGLVDGPSVYGYARQSPMRYTDPRGENSIALGAGAGGVVGGPPGALVGGILGALGLGGYLIYQYCTSDDNSCPPCTPYPKGTIGYREDYHSTNAPGVGYHHLNLYQVNQNPGTCKCFWNPGAKGYGYHANPPAEPDWVPLPSTGRGGDRDVFPPLSR